MLLHLLSIYIAHPITVVKWHWPKPTCNTELIEWSDGKLNICNCVIRNGCNCCWLNWTWEMFKTSKIADLKVISADSDGNFVNIFVLVYPWIQIVKLSLFYGSMCMYPIIYVSYYTSRIYPSHSGPPCWLQNIMRCSSWWDWSFKMIVSEVIMFESSAAVPGWRRQHCIKSEHLEFERIFIKFFVCVSPGAV